MSEKIVNERAQQVLKLLVERYIQEGNPVASRTLAEEYALGLSPATIRNILAELEEQGYLDSPHTSAGRVPTELGYRFFVDGLLTVSSFSTVTLEELQKKINPDHEMSQILQSASVLLSGMTQFVGLVALPKRNKIQLRQVEFLPLSGNRVLVILVLNNREVQNRIIYTEKTYTPSELQQAANYLNTHYTGKDLLSARNELIHAIRKDRDNMADLLRAAADVADKAFVHTEQQQNDYIIAGQDCFLQHTKEVDYNTLCSMFNAFTQKQEILNLLDQALQAEGIQIFIGKESGYEVFDQCSIVTTTYAVDGQLLGSLGVIGPTRMPYDKVISAVDVTAKLLSAALNQA